MRNLNRRDFIKFVGISSASGMQALPIRADAAAAYRVVIIGGGFGGATCANYLKRFCCVSSFRQWMMAVLSKELMQVVCSCLPVLGKHPKAR